MNVYGISSAKLNVIAPFYEDFITKEALAANPDTATKGNRQARNEARKKPETAWRQSLRESIRYNTFVSVADREVFGIRPRKKTRTPAQTPTDTGFVNVKRLGAFEYEIIVIGEQTSKRKLPLHAAGSYLYLAVSEPGTLPETLNAYRKLEFSSDSRHELRIAPSELGKQANIYVRYSNRHGKEGPIGPVETFFIN
jgi:hypothetical protein